MTDSSDAIVKPDHADVAIRPPVLILTALLLAAVLEIALPLGPGLAQGSARPLLIGLGIAVLGALVFARAHRAFCRVGNTVSPRRASLHLVTDDIYAVSRNPNYIGQIVAYFGLALALTSAWAMLLLPVVVAVFARVVIPAEEAYLERRFGAAYRAYAAKVPRWL